jgi:hypothetical protein
MRRGVEQFKIDKDIGACWDRSVDRPLTMDDLLGFDRDPVSQGPYSLCRRRSHDAEFDLPQGGVLLTTLWIKSSDIQEGHGLFTLPVLCFAMIVSSIEIVQRLPSTDRMISATTRG